MGGLAVLAVLFLGAIVLGIFAYRLLTTPVDVRKKNLRERACPVCGAALRDDESLRAEMAGIGPTGLEEIRIKGCPHCKM